MYFILLFITDGAIWVKPVRKIVERAQDSRPWPQLMIFPEGSTSNRKALMSFKPGAFVPEKPVQPILIM